MGKPRQRAVDIPGLQHQSGRCGSRASGHTSKEPIADGERPTAELPVKDFINSEWLLDRTDHRGARTTSACAGRWRGDDAVRHAATAAAEGYFRKSAHFQTRIWSTPTNGHRAAGTQVRKGPQADRALKRRASIKHEPVVASFGANRAPQAGPGEWLNSRLRRRTVVLS